MKRNLFNITTIATLLCAILFSGCCCDCGKPYKIVDNQIVFAEPARAEGQQSMLGFAAEPIPIVRVGFVGLGMRGPGAIKRFVNIGNLCIIFLFYR